MNKRQTDNAAKNALCDAQARWGDKACVRFDPTAPDQVYRDLLRTLYGDTRWPGQPSAELHHFRCTVGHVVMGLFFHVEGQGDSWDEAFADADANKARDHARYQELRGTAQADSR
jgi:hypothetical protein